MKNNIKKTKTPQIAFAIAVLGILYIGISNVVQNSSVTDIKNQTNTVQGEGYSLFMKGSNLDGQLSTTTIADIQDIALGADFSLALKKDGTVWSWGSNDTAQLGRVTKGKDKDSIPAKIQGLENIIQISTSHKHSLALNKNGEVFAFGSNFTGQIGNGNNIDVYDPVKINIKDIEKVIAGYKFSMALDKKGDVYVWGAHCSVDTQAKALELLNSFGSNITSLEGGYYDASSAGEGTYNHSEDCLNESTVGIKSNVPKKLESVEGVTDISAGYGHALLLKKDGTVWSFGCNMYGQLGWEQFDNVTNNATPRKIEGLKNIKKIAAGFRSSLAVDEKNNIYYWGINAKKDVKTGNTFNLPVPEIIPMEVSYQNIDSVSAGRDYTLIVLDGVAYTIGNDYIGLAGADKTFNSSFKKIQISEISGKVSRVSAGGSHAALLFSK